jgi:RHS repeat-associated protein
VKIFVLCVAFWLTVVGPSLAQNPNTERGFAAAKSFAVSDFDSVNLFSGNLVVALPIGPSYPVSEALSYQLTLVYNGKLWDFEQVFVNFKWIPRVTPYPFFNAGLGWTLTLGRIRPPLNADGWLYLAPDGSEHSFGARLHTNVGPEDPNIQYSSDSKLRLRRATREIEFPNGNVHRFDTQGRLVGMRDRFGGTGDDAWITYGATSWTIQDRHGRSQVVHLNAQGNVTSVVFTAPGGGTATWGFEYATFDAVVGCPHVENPRFSASYLTGVVLPASAGRYSMPIDPQNLTAAAYNVVVPPPAVPPPDPAQCDNTSGLLRKLTVPTGGRYEWDYGTYKRPEPGADGEFCRSFFTDSLGVVARRKVDPFGVVGTWTYTPGLEGQGPGLPPPAVCDASGEPLFNQREATTTVVDPLGHTTVNYFSVALQDEVPPLAAWREHEFGLPFTRYTADGGRFLSRRIRAAGASSSLREHYVLYETDAEAGGLPGVDPRIVSERTVDLEGATRRNSDVTRSGYDGLGHYRTETTGGNFDSGNVRTSFTNWNPSRGTYASGQTFTMPGVNEPWILGTFSETRASEGAASATVQFCFDGNTGALLRRRVLAGTAAAKSDLLSVTTIEASSGHRTREELYGGDLQDLPAPYPNVCTAGVPTSSVSRTDFTYSGGVLATATPTDSLGASLGFKTTDRTIDVRTGLPTSERDPSGIAVSYSYDALGRRTAEVPSAGDDARVAYVYTAATTSKKANVVIRRTDNASGAVERTREEVHVDGFGRVVEEQRLMPGDALAKRLSSYDAAGNLASRSEWGSGNSRHRFRFYDPLGRVGRIVAPDNKVTVFGYTGVRKKDTQVFVATSRDPLTGVITETPANTAEHYDRQGRLIKVTEPTGDDTSYFYDINNRLRQVNQGAQTRVFGWDVRGFLLSETHPELGPGTVSYSNYDALGNPGKRVRGAWTLETVFDRLGRPTKIEEILGGGARRTWKEWTYGTGTEAGNRSAGKVTTEKRYNYVVPPGGAIEATVIVTEDWAYGGRGGRPSAKATSINIGAMNWNQGFTWDELGNLASESYPRCTYANCTATAPSSPTQLYGYTRGMLTNVTGYGTLTYHLNGLPATITHQNGVVDTIENDAKERPRPQSITTTGGSRNWPSGIYTYDGAGNVATMGTDYFLYDSLSRIVTSRLHDQPYDGGTEKKQSYSYDRYGNLLTVTTQVATGTPVTRTNSTVTSTNRLSAAGYDLAGNVTAWQGGAYGYDPFDSMRYAPNRVLIYGPGDERIWEFAYTNPSDVSTWVETFTLRGLGGQVKREYRAAGGTGAGNWRVNRDHIHRGSELLASELPQQAATYHYSLDHLGTPRLVTDQAANKIAQHTYYPYGEEATNPSQDAERMKFTGHERDFGGVGTTDDLDYMHARYCSPLTGRFMSLDAVNGKPRVPQSWNRYAYGRGNPLKFVDPDGRDVIYKDAELKTFYEKAAERNYRVRAVLDAFKPGTGRNLTIEKGDPGQLPFGEPRAAVATVKTVKTDVPFEQLDQAYKDGGDKAALALMDAAPSKVTEATIIIGEEASDQNKLHELGHVDEALRDTDGFIKNGDEADKAETVKAYNESLSERIAEDFAKEAKKKQPDPPQ